MMDDHFVRSGQVWKYGVVGTGRNKDDWWRKKLESENSNTFIFNDHPHTEKLPAISLKTLMAWGWGGGLLGEAIEPGQLWLEMNGWERVLCCVHLLECVCVYFNLWRMCIWSILLTLQSNKHLRMQQTKWESIDCHLICATLCCNHRDIKSRCFISKSRRGAFSPPAPNYDLGLGESGSSKQALKWVPKFTPR